MFIEVVLEYISTAEGSLIGKALVEVVLGFPWVVLIGKVLIEVMLGFPLWVVLIS